MSLMVCFNSKDFAGMYESILEFIKKGTAKIEKITITVYPILESGRC